MFKRLVNTGFARLLAGNPIGTNLLEEDKKAKAESDKADEE
jgi:hypothetical protein